VATLLRNGWLLWSGLGGYFAPEYAALVIFSHHEYHLQAELDWAIETLESIKSD